MKHARLLAAILAFSLIVAAFAGCVARNPGKADSEPAPGITEPAPSEPEAPPAAPPESEPDASPGSNEDVSPPANDDNLNVLPGEPNATPGIEPGVLADETAMAAMSADFSKIGALSPAKETGFPGGPVDELNRPSGPLSYQQRYGQLGARFIVPSSDKIYLTFDEGYENGYTGRILDILKEKNVKAVFFITYPYARTETELIKRMIAEGHTVGNHSTKHRIFPDMPLDEAARDIQTLHDYVLAQYGYKMWLFRPPEGAFSEQTLGLAQSMGYDTMLWSFAYRDWDVNNQPLTIEALSNVVGKAHPGEICLLHAVSRCNAEILGEAIDSLREKGLEFADYFYFR
jgi:peptidoglycan-N-acetylmuramic acid deacetylase